MAAFRLRLRAGLAASNCVWESNPLVITVVGNLQLPFETAHAQNRPGKLPMRLLA